jgi:hypothetical protein
VYPPHGAQNAPAPGGAVSDVWLEHEAPPYIPVEGRRNCARWQIAVVKLTGTLVAAVRIALGEKYGDRINQIDIRVARTFRIGRSRTVVAVDVYSALNASPVLTRNNAFVPGGAWLQPTAILSPRFFKCSAELDS